jgi:hypothetical protein
MLLLAIFAFQIKHFVCNVVLQTEYQVLQKAIYGRSGGLVSAGPLLCVQFPPPAGL